MRQSQPIVILIIIIMAIILAAGSFLALTYVQRRPDAPTGTSVINVEGVEVTIRMDPAKAVRVVSFDDFAPEMPAETESPAIPTEQAATQEEPVVTSVEELPTPVAEPTPTISPEPIIFEQYFVKENDSLYSLADRPDSSIALMAQFGIAQDDLVPGALIQLPVGNPAYCVQGTQRPYAVGEGDTAFSISRRFNIEVDELKLINNLDENYTVYGASIICVPR
jgi:LysM repeat protein